LDNEREVRDCLAKKISGSIVGLWLLVAEHLRLGSWDLLKAWTGEDDRAIAPRMAMQLVHESALCVNRIRKKENIAHQGFELINGLPWVASDEQIHKLLNDHTVMEAMQLQESLTKLRNNAGHYDQNKIWAIDPHRLISATQRITPKKKKRPGEPSQKTLQTFFCLDTQTGQPLIFNCGTAGKTVTTATLSFLSSLQRAMPKQRGESPALLLADAEHFSKELLEHVADNDHYDFVLPVPMTKKIKKHFPQLSYQRKWAGYAIATTTYKFEGSDKEFGLIVQRDGEREHEYSYKAFITKSLTDITEKISEKYSDRWSIEEFFNFEQAMGWKRASTLNLNIRYGKMSLALIAQAAMYQLRQKLPTPYKIWTAEHLAKTIFNSLDGDIRVRNDRIIVTIYNAPKHLNFPDYYSNLPSKLIQEGINPAIPWLYDFKLDFVFK